MPKVSVIVPVYNAEKYLERCFDSFLHQSFQNFELILVDDGSTDGSGGLCDKFSTLNKNVFVNHQENQGVSAARQVGLETAKGEYVIFADPDDWVEQDMLEHLVSVAEKEIADVVICDFFINVSESDGRLKQQKPHDLKPDTILRQLLTGELHGSTWNKLYRRDKLLKLDVSFPPRINYCEDLWFNCILFMNPVLNISYLNKAFYHYDFFSNPNGLSRKFSTWSVNDYLRFTGFIFSSLDDKLYENEFSQLRFNTIKLAFRSNCNKDEFFSIYPEKTQEIKKRMLSERMHSVMRLGLSFALNGHLHLGRFILSTYDRLYLPIAKFRQRLLGRLFNYC